MEDYYNKISNWIFIEKYDIFFKLNHPDFMMITNLYFGTTYLKLLDLAIRHSKKNILEEYENSNNPYEAAVYPNGDQLGFYNTCQFDFEDISKIISNGEVRDKLLDYICGFSDNVKDVFEEIEYEEALDFLVGYDLLSPFIEMVCMQKLDMNNFSSYESFTCLFKSFIHGMAHDEYYSMGLDISNYDPEISYEHIRKSIDEYGDFLNLLLFIDSNFENDDTYNVYDPNSKGAYILHKTKRDILKVNPSAKVNLFGKSKRTESKALYLAKKSISKKDPYSISDAIILNPEDNLIDETTLEKYGDLDLIITNSIECEFSEYKEILDLYLDGEFETTKSVLAFKDIKDIKRTFEKLIMNDFLEAIIYFSTHYILILNSAKSKSKKGKFLFIDKSDGEEETRLLGRSFQTDLYSNDKFSLMNIPSAFELSEFQKSCMETVMELYEKYEDSYCSLTIKNDDFDEETFELLII